MNERRDPQPAPEGGPPSQIPAPADGLSTVQQAQRAYAQHATDDCDRCKDIDRDRCTDGDRLWRAWNDACNAAYNRLAAETP